MTSDRLPLHRQPAIDDYPRSDRKQKVRRLFGRLLLPSLTAGSRRTSVADSKTDRLSRLVPGKSPECPTRFRQGIAMLSAPRVLRVSDEGDTKSTNQTPRSADRKSV